MGPQIAVTLMYLFGKAPPDFSKNHFAVRVVTLAAASATRVDSVAKGKLFWAAAEWANQS